MLNTLRSQKALIAENIKARGAANGVRTGTPDGLIRGLERKLLSFEGQIELQAERLEGGGE